MIAADLPVGGTTGLSHEHSAAIDEAAAYLRAVPPDERPRPLLPALKMMFNISTVDAVDAIRESHQERAAISGRSGGG